MRREIFNRTFVIVCALLLAVSALAPERWRTAIEYSSLAASMSSIDTTLVVCASSGISQNQPCSNQ